MLQRRYKALKKANVDFNLILYLVKNSTLSLDKVPMYGIYYRRRKYCDSSYVLTMLVKDNRTVWNRGGYFFMANINNKIKVKIIIMYSISSTSSLPFYK